MTSRETNATELNVSDIANLQGLILSLRKEYISLADTVNEYDSLKRELNLPLGYENLPGAAKVAALSRPDICPFRRMRLLALAGRNNVLRTFPGPLRPEA